MSNELQKVNFTVQGMHLEAVEYGGKLYFDAYEVANHLDYRRPKEALSRHCKNMTTAIIPGTLLIPESDFYRLVFRSRKPEAEAFTRWVCHDVLPSIRKYGMYPPPTSGLSDNVIQLAHEILERGKEKRRLDNSEGMIKSRGELNHWLEANRKAAHGQGALWNPWGSGQRQIEKGSRHGE